MTFKPWFISLTLGKRISNQLAFSLCPFAYISGKEKYVWAHFQVFYWNFNIKFFCNELIKMETRMALSKRVYIFKFRAFELFCKIPWFSDWQMKKVDKAIEELKEQ